MVSLLIRPGVSARSDLLQQPVNNVELRTDEAMRHADVREAKISLAGTGEGPQETW